MLNFSPAASRPSDLAANEYESLLVVLSYLIASAAGYTALAMADWVTNSRSRRAASWPS